MTPRQTSCPACARPRSRCTTAMPVPAVRCGRTTTRSPWQRRGQPHRLVRAGARLRLARPRPVGSRGGRCRLSRPGTAYPAGECDLELPHPSQRGAIFAGPPRTGKRGRPRTTGDRPGTPDDIAAAAGWARVTVTAYGRQESRHVAEVTCPWHGSWHTRTVRLILSRDERTASGYDLALITTDLAASPVAPVARYAARWGIEQAFADARNVLAPVGPRPRPMSTTAAPPALVPDQDRAGLRGHADQAAPHDDRRPVFATPPWSARTRANPRRPRSLGRRHRITTKL